MDPLPRAKSSEDTMSIICPDDALMSELLDGRLPTAFTEQVVGHVENCHNCRGKISSITSSTTSFRHDTLASLTNVFSVEGPRHTSEEGCRKLAIAANSICRDTDGDTNSAHTLYRGTEFIGRYQIVEEIGRGGFGSVLRARDPRLECDVAIKLLHGFHNSDQLLSEARTVASLHHPSIVQVINVSEVGQPDFIVMNYVNGRSLKQLMADGVQPLSRVLQIMISVCEGVAHAHAVGVIHRDLKPANILIDQSGHAFVTDFGLALRSEMPQSRWEIAGTAEYMSPEQVSGDLRNVDTRSDVWALGATLFAAVAGTSPFRRDSQESTLKAIQNEAAPRLCDIRNDLPSTLDAICQKCLAPQRSDRFQSVDELLRELKSLADPEAHSVSFGCWIRLLLHPVSRANLTLHQRAATASAHRRFLPRVVVAIILVIITGMVGYEFRGRSRANELLEQLQSVKLESLPTILKSPDISSRWFGTALRRAVNRESVPENNKDIRLSLAQFAHKPRQSPDLATLISNANAQEFQVLLDVINHCRADCDGVLKSAWTGHDAVAREYETASQQPLAEQISHSEFVTELDRLTELQARYLLVLATLGEHEELLEQMSNRPDPGLRTSLVHSLGASPTVEALLPTMLKSKVPSQVSATLLSMSAFKSSRELTTTVLQLFERHPDSGVHSAAEWLLRRWKLGSDLEKARVHLRREYPASGFNWIEHTSGLTFAILPPGSFVMGSPDSEVKRYRFGNYDPEKQHLVSINDVFAIATTELIKSNLTDLGVEPDGKELAPSEIVTDKADLLPVYISRNLARRFCEEFSAKWNVNAALPTSIQWEYACRAHTATTRFTGYSASRLSDYAVFDSPSRQPIGTRRPNQFGLFDMLGNAAEWCNDSVDIEIGTEIHIDRGISRGREYSAKADLVRSASSVVSEPSVAVATARIVVVFPNNEPPPL